MKNFATWGIVWLGLMVGLTAAPAAQAQTDSPFSSDIIAATGGQYTCTQYAGLTNHIAGCVRVSLDTAAATFFDPKTGFYGIMSNSIFWLMVIAVAVYGCMAAFGMIEKVGRDSIVLLLKIIMITYFSTNTQAIYRTVISMMDSTAAAVVQFVPTSGTADSSGRDFAQITCLKNLTATASATGGGGVSGPWLAMDCLIDSVIGIKINATTTTTPAISTTSLNSALNPANTGLSRGLIYFFFGSYHSSVFGIMIAVLGFVFIWGMINLIIKSLFIYLLGYIGLALLVMMTPIFAPLVLFQVTKSYFDKWVKLMFSFAMQPIIMLVFVVFSISAVDLATFSGDYSVMYRVAGDASRAGNFNLNTYLSTPHTVTIGTTTVTRAAVERKALTIMQVKTDAAAAATIATTEKNGMMAFRYSDCTAANMAANTTLHSFCDQNYPIQFTRDAVDWDVLAAIRSPAVTMADGATTQGQQLSREVMAACLFATIVVFVMNQMLKVIPALMTDLLGDFGQSPGLGAIGSTVPQKQGIKDKLQGIAKGGGK